MTDLGEPTCKVFVSHCSVDKPAVKGLVDALRARGIDAWYDEYEIGPGDDIFAELNKGLDGRDVGLVVFSANTDQGRWVSREISTLFHERVEESKVLIPVILGDGAKIPPLIKPLARVKIEDIDRIVDAIYHRRVKPLLGTPVRPNASHAVIIALARRPTSEIDVTVTLDGAVLASCTHASLPRQLVELHREFLSGFRHATLRSPLAIECKAKEITIEALGRAMAAFCLPAPAATTIDAMLERDGNIAGASVEVAIQAEGSDLAALPYESVRLPGSDRLLVAHPAVTMVHRPAEIVWPLAGPLPGPLKILVAVGAPDEGKTANNVLDHERELQNILDAVEPAQRLENVEVRILEASDPATIGDALRRDQYHVLYITCHGKPGGLELDDEEGNVVDATAADLLDALRASRRAAPVIFLNSCHGAVDKGQTASVAESLLHGGVPAVVAMQTSVSDGYGTALAHAFFEDLSRSEGVLVSRALAHARRALERQRRDALAGADTDELTLPEYATPTVFVAGVESPLVNFGADKDSLQARPVHELDGQVPQLRQDDLIGRRRELRHTLWVLRPPSDPKEGARMLDGLRKGPALALTGIGGVGKSTIAGRAMRRMAEDGFLVASHVGKWDLSAIASAAGGALLERANPSIARRAKELIDPNQEDVRRLQLLTKTLADSPVLLVLDDFEQNLTRDGAAFVDENLPRHLNSLLQAAQRGRLLVTSRFPIPGFAGLVTMLPVGPLSDADVRKLVLRLPGLHNADAAALHTALRAIGNHPRMLELLDALVRGGEGRLPHVTVRLNDLLARTGMAVAKEGSGNVTEAARQALVLGARDVFLDELLTIARQRSLAEVLLQTAISNVPVDAAGVAHMLGDAPATAEAVALATTSLRQLEDMSLVVRMPEGGAWIHRWTAEGLAQYEPERQQCARSARAGRYRLWRAEYESHDVSDLIEAVRNFLRANAWDYALDQCGAVIAVLQRSHQTTGIVSFVTEVLATVPVEHPAIGRLNVTAGDAYVMLAQSDAARRAYAAALAISERLAANEPERADLQLDLAVCHDRMGNVFSALGQSDDAGRAYAAALGIREQLAANEPDRADFQRDLAVSHKKMGNLFVALGQGDEARKAYAAALTIRKRLAANEPDRADLQRDLSVSYSNIGDLFSTLGQGDDAREAYTAALAISELLAANEPERTDLQRDLAISHSRMGDLFRSLGQGDDARNAYAATLTISKRLAAKEPERADLQRELSVSYNKMGDLFRSLGQGDNAREAYADALAIRQRLAANEPERTDLQHDLAVSHSKMGDLLRSLGQGDEARNAYAATLTISKRLAAAEPERTDFQHDLLVSCCKMGDLFRALGQGDDARDAYADALTISQRLAANEPERADYQRDLASSHNRMGDLFTALGQGEDAHKAFTTALEIRKRLAANEPNRADFQRDLWVSHSKMGDLFRALDKHDDARNAYAAALMISERLVANEPERADYQSDLAISYEHIAELAELEGRTNDVRMWLERARAIVEKLAAAEPARADYQIHIVTILINMARGPGGAGRVLLERAGSILRSLHAENRLEPAEHWKIELIAGLLASRG